MSNELAQKIWIPRTSRGTTAGANLQRRQKRHGMMAEGQNLQQRRTSRSVVGLHPAYRHLLPQGAKDIFKTEIF